MTTAKVLDAGAALGAAALVVSGGALLAQHAPGFAKVLNASPDSPVADDLRAAELAAGAVVLMGGVAAALLTREAWPLLLAVATVGGAVAVYEVALRRQARGAK